MGTRLVHFVVLWFSTVLYDLEKYKQTRGYGVGLGDYWLAIGAFLDVFLWRQLTRS